MPECYVNTKEQCTGVYMGFPKIRKTISGLYILGSPCFGQLPHAYTHIYIYTQFICLYRYVGSMSVYSDGFAEVAC